MSAPDKNEMDLQSLPGVASAEGQTDLTNARRFAKRFGDRCRYCQQWKEWLLFDGTRWAPDETGGVVRCAKSIADSLWHSARAFDDRNALNFAGRTASAGGIRGMLKLAEDELPVHSSELDANIYLLNCPNGTVDLRTGELREHRREDYVTKLCPTNFNPDAPSYIWDRFLEDVHEMAPMIDFLQRFFGYCATGDVREQILAVFWGSGSNGKSTELEAVTGTLGPDYSGAAPKDLLLSRKGDSHPTEIADLHGKRMIVAQETDSNRRLAESLVKQLTGGDTIKARRMRENFWQFNPTHKLILCTNHKPQVKGTDHAIWRRLRLVPFVVRFDGAARDKSMPDKLREEREGILAWIVAGAKQWLTGGLTEPEAVKVATAQYRADSDIVGRFIDECCIVQPSVRVKFGTFYEHLEAWAKTTGNSIPGRRATSEYLRDERGYNGKANNGLWFIGVGLRNEAE